MLDMPEAMEERLEAEAQAEAQAEAFRQGGVELAEGKGARKVANHPTQDAQRKVSQPKRKASSPARVVKKREAAAEKEGGSHVHESKGHPTKKGEGRATAQKKKNRQAQVKSQAVSKVHSKAKAMESKFHVAGRAEAAVVAATDAKLEKLARHTVETEKAEFSTMKYGQKMAAGFNSISHLLLRDAEAPTEEDLGESIARWKNPVKEPKFSESSVNMFREQERSADHPVAQTPKKTATKRNAKKVAKTPKKEKRAPQKAHKTMPKDAKKKSQQLRKKLWKPSVGGHVESSVDMFREKSTQVKGGRQTKKAATKQNKRAEKKSGPKAVKSSGALKSFKKASATIRAVARTAPKGVNQLNNAYRTEREAAAQLSSMENLDQIREMRAAQTALKDARRVAKETKQIGTILPKGHRELGEAKHAIDSMLQRARAFAKFDVHNAQLKRDLKNLKRDKTYQGKEMDAVHLLHHAAVDSIKVQKKDIATSKSVGREAHTILKEVYERLGEETNDLGESMTTASHIHCSRRKTKAEQVDCFKQVANASLKRASNIVNAQSETGAEKASDQIEKAALKKERSLERNHAAKVAEKKMALAEKLKKTKDPSKAKALKVKEGKLTGKSRKVTKTPKAVKKKKTKTVKKKKTKSVKKKKTKAVKKAKHLKRPNPKLKRERTTEKRMAKKINGLKRNNEAIVRSEQKALAEEKKAENKAENTVKKTQVTLSEALSLISEAEEYSTTMSPAELSAQRKKDAADTKRTIAAHAWVKKQMQQRRKEINKKLTKSQKEAEKVPELSHYDKSPYSVFSKTTNADSIRKLKKDVPDAKPADHEASHLVSNKPPPKHKDKAQGATVGNKFDVHKDDVAMMEKAQRAEHKLAKEYSDAVTHMKTIKATNAVTRSQFRTVDTGARDITACFPVPSCLKKKFPKCVNTYDEVNCIRARRGKQNLCEMSATIQEKCCAMCSLSANALCKKERLILAGYVEGDKPKRAPKDEDKDCMEWAAMEDAKNDPRLKKVGPQFIKSVNPKSKIKKKVKRKSPKPFTLPSQQ